MQILGQPRAVTERSLLVPQLEVAAVVVLVAAVAVLVVAGVAVVAGVVVAAVGLP